MTARVLPMSAVALVALAAVAPARGDDKAPAAEPPKAGAVSFMKDVAPILVQNCIACHNARKAESKYNMTSFALLAKGGQQGEDITLEPGDPDASRFVELIRPDGQPRMPYKQDPLPPEKVRVIERWVKEGARYDGTNPEEDWVALLHKMTPVNVPESYPVAVPITALAFSPDSSQVAAAGYHEVTLWKAADGSPTRRLRGLAERVYDVAYSPDGRWLATASGDPGQYGAARLWIAEPDGGGKPVRDLVESNDSLFAVAFSPDSKLVAAAGADRAIRIWEVESGKLLATIEDHADWIFDLAFSPDGKRLASASRDKTSKVFDVAKRESLVTFPGHAETVYCVAFAPDGKSVATGGGDNQIRLWTPDNDGKQVRSLGGFGGPVFQLRYHPDGKQLLACSADKTVRVYADNSQRLVLNGHGDWIYSFALSPDGKTVASGSWDGEVRLWNLADGKPLRTIVAAPGLKPVAQTPAQ
jgi:WD40 repeat protein/mono/diheme cytochrome c family protein